MLKLGYRGVRPEARCLAMLLGADQASASVYIARASTGAPIATPISPSAFARVVPLVTDIRQTVVDLDGWNVGNVVPCG